MFAWFICLLHNWARDLEAVRVFPLMFKEAGFAPAPLHSDLHNRSRGSKSGADNGNSSEVENAIHRWVLLLSVICVEQVEMVE